MCMIYLVGDRELKLTAKKLLDDNGLHRVNDCSEVSMSVSRSVEDAKLTVVSSTIDDLLSGMRGADGNDGSSRSDGGLDTGA
jgi:hypothetical protein